MKVMKTLIASACVVTFGLGAFASSAAAQSANLGSAWEFSANIAGTSEYVFRGISQSHDTKPTVQGGAVLNNSLFYVGIWGSGVDFVEGSSNPEGSGDANVEIDIYAGVTPKLGPVDFDFGVIYYAYPGAKDPDGGEFDYVEFKIGASTSPITNLTTGVTYYVSPEQFGEVGVSHVVEGSIGYEFQKIGIFTPSVDALVGGFFLEDDSSQDYVYWNAGLSLAVENVTLDFRYWDTDSDGDDFCADAGLCDERFVFTASVAIP